MLLRTVNNRFAVWLVLVLGLMVVAAGCGSSPDDTAAPDELDSTPPAGQDGMPDDGDRTPEGTPRTPDTTEPPPDRTE